MVIFAAIGILKSVATLVFACLAGVQSISMESVFSGSSNLMVSAPLSMGLIE